MFLTFYSDSGPVLYKTRYHFSNVSFLRRLYWSNCEMFFSANVHGKNSADGIGGSVKKIARLEAKRRYTLNQILTPYDLLSWANSGIPSIDFKYVPVTVIEDLSKKLERRFKRAVAIPGTRSFHSYRATKIPDN